MATRAGASGSAVGMAMLAASNNWRTSARGFGIEIMTLQPSRTGCPQRVSRHFRGQGLGARKVNSRVAADDGPSTRDKRSGRIQGARAIAIANEAGGNFPACKPLKFLKTAK